MFAHTSGADVAELADALDSKSSARKGVWVRFPPSVPNNLVRQMLPTKQGSAGTWELLRPEEIGVQLTEGFMMDPKVYPESFSGPVSALVFHHPDCAYFGVGDVTDSTE